MSNIGENSGPSPLTKEWTVLRDEICRLVRTQKVPNGLLFTGAPGTGKEEAAHFLAKALNCAEGQGMPCGTCGSCRKLDAGMHPDFICIEPEANKKNIAIAQVYITQDREDSNSHLASFESPAPPRRISCVGGKRISYPLRQS